MAKENLNPFENADQGYQTQQSILAVGSGGMEGKGLKMHKNKLKQLVTN